MKKMKHNLYPTKREIEKDRRRTSLGKDCPEIPFRESRRIREEKDEYYLSSMFPNDDVMHRVYSIIKDTEERRQGMG